MMARNLVLRQIKELKTLRKFSRSCILYRNDDYIIKSPISDITMPNMRLMERLWLFSSSFQDHVAIECAVTKKKYTYKKIIKNTAVFATSLRKKLGLNPNDIVISLLPNIPEYPVVALGTIQAGCIFSSVNPIYKEVEICHQVSITEPKLVVTIPECYDTVVKGLKMAKSPAKIVLIDSPNKPVPEGTIRYTEIAETDGVDYALLDGVEKNLEDVALIPFSSGTTGLPKGVEITYKNLIAALEVMAKEENCFPILTNGNQQDVVPCILPFFHIYGMVVTLLGHFVKGCKLITLPRFSANTYFDVLKNQNPTILYVVPPVAILLGKHPEVTKDHLKHVKYMVCGAAPLSASDANAVLEKSNGKLEFKQGYGATETTSLTTSTLIGATDIDYSSCGMPLAHTEIMFLGSDGKPVPIGEPGELCTRSPTVMKGYYKNEKATKESMTDDGFFKTGDLGHYDPKYGLYVTDRIKELIKVKGMQVAPAELEGLLRSHPAVADAAVIGVPHEYFGEAPKAFIIRKGGQNTSPEELQDFIANKVASFKKIEEVVFVDDIPKTTSGKILRKELKKMYA
ncbi:uncharacterized protein LOC116770681 [Danaus plexippus]|uniref:uncharacterized protein LOC116770681 n=1 Tax=Danaus plexippus TaxID=13037 RepID=UPI0013C3E989|nr:uncharacterized protein LOC116770681 [Danaus plexippus]